MHARLTTLAFTLFACTTTVWAATSNVGLPAFGTYSAAAEIGTNFFTNEPYIPQSSSTSAPGETASITQNSNIPISNPYTAAANTTLGTSHAFAHIPRGLLGGLGVSSFSGWYDQVTITGGTGTGSVQFSVQLNGTVSVGEYAGGAAYGLFASPLHPSQLVDSLNIIDPVMPPTQPWALSAPLGFGQTPSLTTITSHAIGVSPYNDPSVLFTTTPPVPVPTPGIPALETPKTYADLVLTPGANQSVNMTLTGTLTFTYGEAFYLIGALGTGLFDGLTPFCAFDIGGGTCTPPVKDGTGPTTLDFFNSAHLDTVVLPQGASFSSASGAAYNVTAVPEPGEWLMLLAGLGLVGWRARRRA